jgi:mRNA deadenylase 3'-5' endonuclease subunit Ccr4/uncharacterized protein with PIN domain
MGRKVGTKKKKSRRSNKKPSGNSTADSSWVENLVFEPIAEDDEDDTASGSSEKEQEKGEEADDDQAFTLSLISWNVLAESYCSRQSHTNLPIVYQQEVFDKKKRRARINQRLSDFVSLQVDVLCLQEVDLDEIGQLLRQKGFVGVETPRNSGGGAGGRSDSVCVYTRSDVWELVDHQLIRLDDLASLSSNPTEENVEEGKPIDMNNFHGLSQSFLRRNAALLVRLRHVTSGKTVVVANAHLYWNPGYEYVKLCQSHYILTRAKSFILDQEPLVLCGDLNSRPGGAAHSYLTRGTTISAKRYAPWYHYDPDDEEEDLLDDSAPADEPPPRIRYLLDVTLNKLCRWLRILGQDAVLETEEEERLRTQEGKMVLIERCHSERRTLITTSTRLMRRRDCPPGAYCINPSMLPSIGVVLVHILLTHGVVLDPQTILSRCVVCNGKILAVDNVDERRRIYQTHTSGGELDEEMEVWQCNGCHQGYWWSEQPASSASRVKNTATMLMELCLRGGVPMIQEEGNDIESMALFADLDIQELRSKGWDMSQEGGELLQQKLDVIEWLKEEKLKCPFELESVYAFKDQQGQMKGEILPFTNVTNAFVNTLDYIFFSTGMGLTPMKRLYVPKTFNELNGKDIKNGHLLPSNIWPSDHLAVGCRFQLERDVSGTNNLTLNPGGVVEKIPSIPTMSPPPTATPGPAHGRRCDCGCVPNIPGLFEMAELRKQAKMNKAANK